MQSQNDGEGVKIHLFTVLFTPFERRWGVFLRHHHIAKGRISICQDLICYIRIEQRIHGMRLGRKPNGVELTVLLEHLWMNYVLEVRRFRWLPKELL